MTTHPKNIPVGEVVFYLKNHEEPHHVLQSFEHWLHVSGWKGYVDTQVQATNGIERVGLMPGRYQSNPAQCYFLEGNASPLALDFIKKWIEEIVE